MELFELMTKNSETMIFSVIIAMVITHFLYKVTDSFMKNAFKKSKIKKVYVDEDGDEIIKS